MKILALDLSTRQGSIALCDGEILERKWPNDQRASAPFFLALDEIIRAQGAPDQIVVGLGPGSYTGTRIAISAAIGLQFTTGAKLFGLPSICALSDEKNYFAMGDAKRATFFLAEIRDRFLVQEPELLSADEMANRIAEVSASVYTSDRLPRFEKAQLRFPAAKHLCTLALEFPHKLIRAPLAPIYLREPHITQPRKK